VAALVAAHAEHPFTPTEPRDAARRVVELASRLGVEATVFRGGLDVGAAEVDHVWAVLDGRVVDPSFPLRAPSFLACVRAFVAGDVDDATLDLRAHPYSLEWRVVGAYPRECRYVGQPLWSES
jgi:hypothetical protein